MKFNGFFFCFSGEGCEEEEDDPIIPQPVRQFRLANQFPGAVFVKVKYEIARIVDQMKLPNKDQQV